MFNYDMREIIDSASSLTIFRRGFDYYKAGKVIKYNYNDGLEQAFAKVEGTELYHVDIRFEDGNIKDAFCECRAYYEYPGFCKHIVASLLYGKLTLDVTPKEVTINDLLDYYLDEDFEDIDGQLTVQMSYVLNYHEELKQSYLNVKVGELGYVLKEPEAFFRHIRKKESYEFGKKFTYDPYVHTISEKDRKVMDFIQEVLDGRSYTKDLFGVKSAETKDIYLSDRQLITLLDLIEVVDLKIYKVATYENLLIRHEELELKFKLRETEDGFDLDLSELLDYKPLNSKHSILKKDNYLYVLSKKQYTELKPLLNLIKNQIDVVRIKKDQLNSFMSYLYPILNRTCKIRLSRELRTRLFKEKCVPKLYLDLDDDKITADLKYHYGSYEFDAFQEEEHNELIILRDLKKENKVMHLLETSAFKVSKDGYYMDNDEDIFNFLDEGIYRLKGDVDVYYSDAFNTLSVKDEQSISISSTLKENLNYFGFMFSIEGIDQSDIPDLLRNLKEKKTFYRLKEGSFISLDHMGFAQLDKMMMELDLKPSDFSDEIILPSYMSYYVNKTIDAIDIERNEGFLKLIEDTRNPNSFEVEVPEIANGTFREYQEVGFKWLKSLSKYHFGGILADDMGLGKTIQTLGYIQSEREKNHELLTLIVAPTSLTYNWLNELNKFFPKLNGVVIDGVKTRRKKLLEEANAYDLVITSYALVRNDLEMYKELKLDICIIDEAQHIKNPTSKTAKALKQLDVNRRYALTGTPIENSVIELWSIFDFIMPMYLGSVNQFRTKYEKPIKNGDLETSDRLRKMIDPFILRRLKQDVLKELPDKIENKIIVDLHDDQKKVYIGYLDKVKHELNEAYRTEGYQKSQMKTLAALMRLRQICLDPSLFLEDYEGTCAKVELLKELIEELMEGNHKVLIFSQFTGMLSKIKLVLEEMNYEYFSLDGSTKSSKRGELVDRFNAGEKPIFLISLKAGGTGLNLTGADTVIHFDPWWNPAVEDQATDRAHRIGQTNKVHVIKLVTKGTIEEKIYELQMKKKALIEKVIQPGETMLHHLSEDDIKELFE